MSDGLVSNVSLTLGVAGTHAAPAVIRLPGFAALVAEATSMTSGEYPSGRAQVELLSRELEIEVHAREELGLDPVRLGSPRWRRPSLAFFALGAARVVLRPRSGGSCPLLAVVRCAVRGELLQQRGEFSLDLDDPSLLVELARQPVDLPL